MCETSNSIADIIAKALVSVQPMSGNVGQVFASPAVDGDDMHRMTDEDMYKFIDEMIEI